MSKSHPFERDMICSPIGPVRDFEVSRYRSQKENGGEPTSTIDDTGAQHRTVAESTSFVEDLRGQLTAGAYDQHQWLSSNALSNTGLEGSGVWTWSRQLLCLAHQLGENRNEESLPLR